MSLAQLAGKEEAQNVTGLQVPNVGKTKQEGTLPETSEASPEAGNVEKTQADASAQSSTASPKQEMLERSRDTSGMSKR